MLTKSIEQLKFNLENYPNAGELGSLEGQVKELAEYDHTAKTSYLEGLVGCMAGRGVAA